MKSIISVTYHISLSLLRKCHKTSEHKPLNSGALSPHYGSYSTRHSKTNSTPDWMDRQTDRYRQRESALVHILAFCPVQSETDLERLASRWLRGSALGSQILGGGGVRFGGGSSLFSSAFRSDRGAVRGTWFSSGQGNQALCIMTTAQRSTTLL